MKLVLDTSSLLTLLLAHEDVNDENDVGLLAIITDMAAQDVASVVITDMVLAEFLNSAVPLSIEDVLQIDEDGTAVGTKYDPNAMTFVHRGYRQSYEKAEERLHFLKDLYNTENARFLATQTGEEYLDAICMNERLQHSYAGMVESDNIEKSLDHTLPESLTEFDNASLTRFLRSNSDVAQKVIQDIRREKLRSDRGEVSIGDALLQLHQENPKEDVFVMYEGSDVRGHIIARVNNPDAGYQENRVEKEYNPHRMNFDKENLSALGQGGFITTLGFVASIMQMMEKQGGFLEQLNETQLVWDASFDENKDTREENSIQATYEKILATVGDALGGRARVYNSWKDVRFEDMEPNLKHEHALATGIESPFNEVIMGLDTVIQKEITVGHMDRLQQQKEGMLEKLLEQTEHVHIAHNHVLDALREIRSDVPAASVTVKESEGVMVKGDGVQDQSMQATMVAYMLVRPHLWGAAGEFIRQVVPEEKQQKLLEQAQEVVVDDGVLSDVIVAKKAVGFLEQQTVTTKDDTRIMAR